MWTFILFTFFPASLIFASLCTTHTHTHSFCSVSHLLISLILSLFLSFISLLCFSSSSSSFSVCSLFFLLYSSHTNSLCFFPSLFWCRAVTDPSCVSSGPQHDKCHSHSRVHRREFVRASLSVFDLVMYCWIVRSGQLIQLL